MVEQLSSPTKLHDQEEVLGGLNDLVELDEVGVPHQLQNVDLPRHPLDIGDICDLFLLQHFDGDFFVGGLVDGQLDLPESALSQCFF